MSVSEYKIIELVGVSEVSWENAAENAIAKAGENLRQLRVAEVIEMDMTFEDGRIDNFRTRVALSFRHED